MTDHPMATPKRCHVPILGQPHRTRHVSPYDQAPTACPGSGETRRRRRSESANRTRLRPAVGDGARRADPRHPLPGRSRVGSRRRWWCSRAVGHSRHVGSAGESARPVACVRIVGEMPSSRRCSSDCRGGGPLGGRARHGGHSATRPTVSLTTSMSGVSAEPLAVGDLGSSSGRDPGRRLRVLATSRSSYDCLHGPDSHRP